MEHRNIKKGIKKRSFLETNGDAFWLNKKSKNHGNGLCEGIVQQIVFFWTSRTTISPNAKDVIRKRIGVKKYEEHVTHDLQISQVHFFPNFEQITGWLLQLNSIAQSL